MMLDDFEFILTPAMKDILSRQTFGDDGPGTILADMATLLDLVANGNLRAVGKYHTLPMEVLAVLNARLRWPCHVTLDRPTLHSFPNLEGLLLVARASGLLTVQGAQNKACLQINPPVMAVWQQLNPTERYFNLFEAWLLHAKPEIIGARSGRFSDFRQSALRICLTLQTGPKQMPQGKACQRYFPVLGGEHYIGVLMAQFGLIAIEQARAAPKSPWQPTRITALPFGDALFAALCDDLQQWSDLGSRHAFGKWRRRLGPYFPQWRHNLPMVVHPFRDGTWIFTVRLGSLRRRIAMPARLTLAHLADAILNSVEFDFDHLYQFTYTDRMGRQIRATHSYMDPCDDEVCANDVPIGDLPLEPGSPMEFHYDFGDDWRFAVGLDKIDPSKTKRKHPQLLESRGKPPRQYADYDEPGEDDDEMEDVPE